MSFFQVIPDWLELVALACCIGALVCSLWVVGSARSEAISADEGLVAGMSQLLRIGAAALFVSSVLGLLVRSAEMSGYPIPRVLSAIPAVLLRTHFGHAWLLRMAAIVALSVTIAVFRDAQRSRPLQRFMLGCVVVVSAMNSASGHAANTGDFSAAEIVDWLHLAAALVWGGALLVLSCVILPHLVKQEDRAASSMARVATRFSRIAGIGVGLILLTSCYQQWTLGGSVGGLPRSPFGRAIIVKAILFSVLLGLGAFNRYIFVPRLQERGGSRAARLGALGRLVAPALLRLGRDERGPLAAARFTRTVQLEAVLLVAVLLCAALLRHEAPARHEAHLERKAMARAGEGKAALSSPWIAGEGSQSSGAGPRNQPSKQWCASVFRPTCSTARSRTCPATSR